MKLKQKEVWKPIPNLQFYEASSMGRIRSLDKEIRIYNPRWNCIMFRPYKGRIISCKDNGKGYLHFVYSNNGRNKHIYVHRAVLMAFVGDPKGKQANHKNGIKSDNRIENLEWCTRKENMSHAVKTGLLPMGDKHYINKIPDQDIAWIKRCILSNGEIARLYGVKSETIRRIKIGTRRMNHA